MMPENEASHRMNVLVTGGSGFLGKAILEELVAPDSPLQPDVICSLDISPPMQLAATPDNMVDRRHPRL